MPGSAKSSAQEGNLNLLGQRLHFRPAAALRERLRLGYNLGHLRADLLAGIIVGLVAIPLGMALAIASGVPPQHGLYTVIIGGFVVALLGGSRFQVTGPTAAFVVILAPVVARFGFYGLLMAGLMSGVILLFMGLTGVGRLIQFIPHPVTTGFTSGIALVIATIQLKDFFGLRLESAPDHALERLHALWLAAPSWRWQELCVAALTLAVLLLWPRFNKRIPAPLVALGGVGLLAWLAQHYIGGFEVDTIASRFSYIKDGVRFAGIPQALPQLHLPWFGEGADHSPTFVFNWQNIRALVPPAFAIALLGAIESLLSAVVADGMGRTRHDPDAELTALGIGNILCPFFGGIPATGALARTATNIRSGAVSPLASASHAVFVLIVLLSLAPLVSALPMAALAAQLLLVAWRMSEVHNFRHIVSVAPRSDVFVLFTCFSLTVLFDMVIGVGVGIVLAALLFMKRMAEMTSAKTLLAQDLQIPDIGELSHKIVFYEIAGPLFFGATRKAVDALNNISDGVKVVVFDMQQVPVMDVTGLVALESSIERLRLNKQQAILTRVNRGVKKLIAKSSSIHESANVAIFDSLEDAISMAKKLARGA